MLFLLGCLLLALPARSQWTRLNQSSITGSTVNIRAIQALNETTLYAGTEGKGVYASLDGGQTWKSINDDLKNAYVWSLAVLDNTLYVGVGDGKGGQGGAVYSSTNSGVSWTHLYTGFRKPPINSEGKYENKKASVYALYSNNGKLYAGVAGNENVKGIYLLKQGGDSSEWVPIAGEGGEGMLDFTGIHCITTSESKLYAGSRDGVHVSSSMEGGVWAKTNGSPPRNIAVSPNASVRSIAVNGDVMCMSRFNPSEPSDGEKKVYLSTNGGNTWNEMYEGFPDGNIPVVYSLVTANHTIYAGTNRGVFLLEKSGDSYYWQEFNEGLPVRWLPTDPSFSVYKLEVSGNHLYAATKDGVWRMPLPPLEPAPDVSVEENPETVTKIQNIVQDYQLSVKVNRALPPDRVELVCRSITRPTWYRLTANYEGDNSYLVSSKRILERMNAGFYDEIGLEYYFEVTYANNKKLFSGKRTLGIYHGESGLPFEGLVNSAGRQHYQIISVPLNLDAKRVEDVLGDDLGRYRRRKWRLFSWQNNELVEYRKGFLKSRKGFGELEPGKGYLLLVKKQTAVDTGPGSTLHSVPFAPFQIALKPGWNLIGNPYNINLNWKDVLQANRVFAGEDKRLLIIRDGNYQESDSLKRFSGGFVWSTDEDTLTLPVRRDPVNGYNSGRLSFDKSGGENPDENAHLEVNFTLQRGKVTEQAGGLGMHARADLGYDPLDKLSMPPVLPSWQLHFSHPEHLAGGFAKDMVPVQEQYVWAFTLETHTNPEEALLRWNTYFATAEDKELLLYDIEAGSVVDMQHRDTYRLQPAKRKQFKVYYGPRDWLAQTVKPEKEGLLSNVPNPFNESTKLTFTLPDRGRSYQVDLDVYDLNARKVASLASGSYEAGFHEMHWQGRYSDGSRVPAGIYLAKLQVDRSRQYTIRLVVQ